MIIYVVVRQDNSDHSYGDIEEVMAFEFKEDAEAENRRYEHHTRTSLHVIEVEQDQDIVMRVEEGGI